MRVRAPAQPRIDRAEPVADMFWGDRFRPRDRSVRRPLGDRHSHGGRVSEEISRRAAEAFKQT